MTMVPGASLPSNGTVSRGMGVATGCSCESSALAKTGAVAALSKRPAQTAARIRLRRMIPPWRQSTTDPLQPDSARSRDYCGKEAPCNELCPTASHECVNCVKLWRRRHNRGPGAAEDPVRSGQTLLTLPYRSRFSLITQLSSDVPEKTWETSATAMRSNKILTGKFPCCEAMSRLLN